MSHEVIVKKLEQMRDLLGEIERLLATPFDVFSRDLTAIRAAERNFQLLVDFASDVNTQILLERGKKTPDTYRQSVLDAANIGLFPQDLVPLLAESVKLRNILVHEYDTEEDYKKFYSSAKRMIPAYRSYLKQVAQYMTKKR